MFKKKSAAGGGGKKVKKRDVIANRTGEDLSSFVKVLVEKPDEHKAAIAVILKGHYVTQDLDDELINDIVDVMKPAAAGPGDAIITEGQDGDTFYLMISGNADIIIGGNKVAEYSDSAAFGELALMYNAPRAATIMATEPCMCYTLDMRSFRFILAASASTGLMAKTAFLKKVPLLKPLNDNMITKAATAMTEKSFEDGDYIIRQGDPGEEFFVIKEGSVRCTSSKDGGEEIDLITLDAGTYFGEMALMLDEPRHANCISKGPCTCYVLSREDFESLIGSMQNITQTLAMQMRTRILKSVPLLALLTDEELLAVSDAMRVQIFGPGDTIIRQGNTGERFYIINDGEVVVTIQHGSGKPKELTRLSTQEYFGERALITQEPRKATISAVTEVECLVLDRISFQKLILPSAGGSFGDEMLKRESDGPGGPKRGPRVNIPFNELTQLATIGTGTFGRVKLVQHKPTGTVAALKAMSKVQIVQSHQEKNIMNEKNIMDECVHPFILAQLACYQDRDELYILMEIISGGELWTYIYEHTHLLPRTKNGGFTVPHSQFYAACVIDAFKYMQKINVAYRDLKPENLLMDASGYLKVIDFGFAKHIPFEKGGKMQMKSFTLCGTPEYLSPELVLSKGHDKSADYWALGCLVFELLLGRTPFAHEDQQQIFKMIIQSAKYLSFPKGVDANAQDLITKLLTPNAVYRLGNLQGGVQEICDHQWFKKTKFNWKDLFDMKLKAPHLPPIKDKLDTSHFDPHPEKVKIPAYKGRQDIFDGF